MAKINRIVIIALLILAVRPDPAVQANGGECVVLLHGLARTSSSMGKMARCLENEGYKVVNFDYPSRKHPIEELAEKVIPEAIGLCREGKPLKVNFVTHSLGGILVRYYLKKHQVSDLGRVVMLSPPNKGSEVVDKLGGNIFFRLLNGPAGLQLGTGETGIPSKLGPVDFSLGVITGDRTINLILSGLIPGNDDGKVSLDRAKVAGMADYLVVHASHPFIMKNNQAIEQTLNFLKNGTFKRSSP